MFLVDRARIGARWLVKDWPTRTGPPCPGAVGAGGGEMAIRARVNHGYRWSPTRNHIRSDRGRLRAAERCAARPIRRKHWSAPTEARSSRPARRRQSGTAKLALQSPQLRQMLAGDRRRIGRDRTQRRAPSARCIHAVELERLIVNRNLLAAVGRIEIAACRQLFNQRLVAGLHHGRRQQVEAPPGERQLRRSPAVGGGSSSRRTRGSWD